MIINHKIYGRFEITEPVLIELIKSPALERLKKIGQLGANDFHYTCAGKFTRYQHSIGVMLLLRKFGAGLKEQTVGLLHDISHTAFSHVADFVFNSNIRQDYQDSRLSRAFEIQGINKILKKHKISPVKILNNNFPLAENELPNLCADRIDYALQDPNRKSVAKIDPKKILGRLTIKNNSWVFTDEESARKFARLYLALNKKVWCNPLQAALYKTLSDAIKTGLAKKIITKKDLFTTDQSVMAKLKKSGDAEIRGKISQLKMMKIKNVLPKQADLCLKSKPRAVDPYFLKNGKLTRLSAVDKNYKNEVNSWLKAAKKGFCLKIIAPDT
ncbi:MAG: HD domain-containing protein [Patescibacteria group bacterium]